LAADGDVHEHSVRDGFIDLIHEAAVPYFIGLRLGQREAYLLATALCILHFPDAVVRSTPSRDKEIASEQHFAENG